ncbi:MAG: hypothetical protein ACRD2G_19835 [Terriglobia bacterium]
MQESISSLHWSSGARLHHPFRPVAGALIFDRGGIGFRANRGKRLRWPFAEIKTFDLTPRRLVLTTYQDKGWHRPGDRQYRFDLSRPIPPSVAAQLAQLVGKPVINGDPRPRGESFALIPARHRTLAGGTNGVLHFSETGICYITPHNQDARSWRWADIQTLANPDPYHFRVGGYRETFDFELKQPMPEKLFDRLWDHVYAHHLQVSPDHTGAAHHETDATK